MRGQSTLFLARKAVTDMIVLVVWMTEVSDVCIGVNVSVRKREEKR